MNIEHEQSIRRKSSVFFDEKTVVHLKLNNGVFYNGRLFEVNDNYLVIHDRVDGRRKIFLFDIKDIEEFRQEARG